VAAQFEAGEVRHDAIGDHNIGRFFVKGAKRFAAITGKRQRIVMPRQDMLDELTVDGLIVHHQDFVFGRG